MELIISLPFQNYSCWEAWFYQTSPGWIHFGASCLKVEIESVCKKIEETIQGILVENIMFIDALTQYLTLKWNLKSSLNLSLQSDGTILFRFSDKPQRNNKF